MSQLARRYHGAQGVGGPLLYLRRTTTVALGEWVEIRVPGEHPWRGQVIDAGRDISVIQVLEDTVGLAPAAVEITLTGEEATTVVGRELLGRAFNGMGAPIDGLPAPIGDATRSVWGAPLNPIRRARPSDFIETGISAIDGMNTLVRGQKLPVFSGPGLPGLDLAARIVESARAPHDEPFAVVFVGIGITSRDTDAFLARFDQSGARDRSVLYLNQTRDPAIERLLAPRVALAQAEYLAFDLGMHVLVVIADLIHYCEALREIATAREEIPGRRGYPGYMYSDLASIYERAGVLLGKPGSVTQLPILTMPDDDITHPIPDLTGYITEGQVVLSRDLHRRGIFPPVDVLPSLSRLMQSGIGAGKTTPEHREWSNQLYATYTRGRDARMMATIVGETGLAAEDRRALAFADRFETEFVGQGESRRSIGETLELGWQLLRTLPREDLHRLSDTTWAAHQHLPAPERPT
jgi:V/A-type H+-transporting ATPase subunit B